MGYKILIFLIPLLLITGCAKSNEQKELSLNTANGIDIRLEGAVYPIKKQILIPSVTGYVKKIFVKNGDRVKKGELIYTIDKQSMRFDMQSLQVQIDSLKKIRKNLIADRTRYGNIYAVNIAARELKKVAQLRAQGYANAFEENQYKKNYINAMYSNRVTKENNYKNLKDLDTNIKTNEIALAKLAFEYKHADMYAHINGFIAGLHITQGEQINAGSKLGSIVNINKVIVKAGFSGGLLPFLYLHQKIHIDFITTPPYSTTARISQVNPIVNEKYGTMTVEAELNNHNYQLQEGTRALVTVELSKQGQEEARKYFLNNKNDRVLEIRSKI
jgi:multidrug resistance efflux pump